jgi:hypothetical protein
MYPNPIKALLNNNATNTVKSRDRTCNQSPETRLSLVQKLFERHPERLYESITSNICHEVQMTN